MTALFLSREPTLEEYWRAIVLFGRNVASYKFALAKSLLEIRPAAGQLLKLEDLAPTYSRHLSQHLQGANKQGTFKSSKFLDACRKSNTGEINASQLIEATVRYGFSNVIDAFHVVGQRETPQRFYIDERKINAGIRITDEFASLLNSSQMVDLPQEVEARWRLVETAWELGITRSLVAVDYDTSTESLVYVDKSRRRGPITGSRDSLNGYQKGRCFYCYSEIHIDPSGPSHPDVDHFFPHILKRITSTISIDGIWNLVLACKDCNRGIGGKFDRVPNLALLERLHRRNEFLISSHHPLREVLMQQTGNSEGARATFLNSTHNQARAVLIHEWAPVQKANPCF